MNQDRRSPASTMAEAFANYRKTWGDAEPGMLRDGRRGFYYLPRWADNWEFLALHVLARLQRKCPSCHMRQGHKMDCHGGARFADHLRRVHLWPQEKFD